MYPFYHSRLSVPFTLENMNQKSGSTLKLINEMFLILLKMQSIILNRSKKAVLYKKLFFRSHPFKRYQRKTRISRIPRQRQCSYHIQHTFFFFCFCLFFFFQNPRRRFKRTAAIRSSVTNILIRIRPLFISAGTNTKAGTIASCSCQSGRIKTKIRAIDCEIMLHNYL